MHYAKLKMNGPKDDLPGSPKQLNHLEATFNDTVSTLGNCHLRAEDRFYLVTSRWLQQLPAAAARNVDQGHIYRSYSSETAQSIEETDVVIKLTKQDNLHLQDLSPGKDDYILLPEVIWESIRECDEECTSASKKENEKLPAEVDCLCLWLTVSKDASYLTVRFSSQGTMGNLYQRAQELESEQIRLWVYFGKVKNSCVTNHSDDIEFQKGLEVLLKVQVIDSWSDYNHTDNFQNGMLSPLKSSFSIQYGSRWDDDLSLTSSSNAFLSYNPSTSMNGIHGNVTFSAIGIQAMPAGITGLENLGNTCFMNSALQCLVHTPQLAEFFLQDYGKQINCHNPLGMQGELAIAFGELLRNLWAPGRKPVAPRTFKATLARFAPQFSGYNQHDSQELLAFLLDGLHEDLNRVKQKPCIEAKDSNGRPDEEVADEHWQNHKARNDSIIVDVCQGQYKSTLVCPVCSKVSITFDPFMYLSLPLPSSTTQTITVHIFTNDGNRSPMPCIVTIPKPGKLRDLLFALNKACDLRPDEKLLLTEIYSHGHFKILENPIDLLSAVHENDCLTAHRLSKASDHLPLLVFENRRMDRLLQRWMSFGSPLIVHLPEGGLKTGGELLGLFQNLLQPLSQLDAGDIIMSDDESDIPQSNEFLSSSVDNAHEACSNKGHSQPSFEFKFLEPGFLGKEVPLQLDATLPSVFNSNLTNLKLQVTVYWSEEALTSYDISKMEALPQVSKLGFPLKLPRQESVSLYSCLEAFLKEEPLGPDDMWYCPHCKEHRQASKKLDLWRLPEILVFHLKRFSFSRFFNNKLETYVEFLLHNLDLSKYVPKKDGASYELYAVSNHYGSMGGGHYTAYVKLVDDNRWYNFDDSYVSPVGEDEVKTSAAYVLFYRRIKANSAFTNGTLL